jgi:hypothetical protein
VGDADDDKRQLTKYGDSANKQQTTTTNDVSSTTN